MAAFVCAALFTQAQIVDPSFEAGAGSGAWTEFSLNFGTPLCDLASCGNCGGPCVARTGDNINIADLLGARVPTGGKQAMKAVPTAKPKPVEPVPVVPKAVEVNYLAHL